MIPLHEHVLDRLNAYLDRTLSPADAAVVKRHCARCASCRKALIMHEAERWVGPGKAVGAVPDAARPPRVGSRVFAFFWLTLAVAGMVLAGFHVYYANLKPSPYDLRVLGQSAWLPGTDAALHLRVLRHDGGPERGVPVTVGLTSQGSPADRRVQLASLTTGDHGEAVPRFQLPDWPDGSYQLQVTARPTGARSPETIARTVTLKHAWRLMSSTDKPVYQPGQVIHMRGLALRRPDLKPVAGQVMSFSLTDPRGNVVFREGNPTSQFGIGSADCPLAGELIEGNYHIDCRVGETTSRTTVEVKRYVLPRFKVALTLDQPYYQPGQLIKGRVQADYVFGKPVADEIVTVTLESTDVAKASQTKALRTDAKGAAAFEWPLPATLIGREPEGGSARVAVTATVKDPAGQTQERTETRVVAMHPIRIEVIPEAGALVQNLPNTIHILTTTLDGRPVQTRLSVSGLDRELRTSALGVASFEFSPWAYRTSWTIQATDDQGRIGRRQVVLTLGAFSGNYLVRTDKAVYDGGESVRVLVLGGGVEPVFLDLIKDGQTVLGESIEIHQGRGERTIDLPPELFGTVVLHAYRYGLAGLPVHESRVIYIRPARALSITMTTDRAEYRPGERAALSFALTDEHGKPAPGAISLAAVDEAVFGVLDRRPGLEKTFFTLEQELLKPVYEIEDWTPDEAEAGDLVRTAAPAVRVGFEQALFARTARGPEGLAVDEAFVADEEMGAAVVAPSQQQAGLHSLAISTYREKLRRLEPERLEAIFAIASGWALLVLIAVLGSLVWMFLKSPLGCTILIIFFLALLALMTASCANRESAPTSASVPASAAADAPAGGEGADTVRVRQNFPETLLWRPELITDDQGHVHLYVDLADSITTWRVSLGAVSAEGSLGGAQSAIRVFQPFFVDVDLPTALTRGDEIGIPVVVSNYLDKPQTVSLVLADAPWFERLEESAERSVELEPNEVRAVHFRIQAKTVGHHDIQVTGRGRETRAQRSRGVADAVRRPIEVVSDGRLVERLVSGTLQRPAEVELSAPKDAISGSVQAIVKIYPSSFSQLAEGLDAIFQRPYGCFEQTSSTTYPNVLALDYLRRIGKSVPQVEAKARQYIHLGYQRLLSFEIISGGFDWFGNPPANRTLTAYGLMEFQDMAKVHDVDPNLIARTRRWLLGQQKADGSWEPEGHMLHDDPTGARSSRSLARLGTTAYIAWSVFSGQTDPRARATMAYLQGQADEAREDPYILTLIANALLAIDPEGASAQPALDQLESLQQTSKDGKLAWWGAPESAAVSRSTLFYGAGESQRIETTAMAVLALRRASRSPESVRKALAWLVARKDGHGTWGSTQATVLALKALLAGTGAPLGGDKLRRIAILLDGEILQELAIAADQSDVMKQVDLSGRVTPAPGTHRLTIEDRSGTDSGYQVVFRYHEPDTGDRRDAQAGDGGAGPLSIRLDYDRTTIAVDETVTAVASVTNNRTEPAPMVILDLPVPAGFAIDADDLAGMVKAGSIAKFQVTARSAIVYLRDLKPGAPLTLRYHLRATMPVKLTVPSARAYEYYAPSRQGSSPTMQLTVNGKS
jgi:hypothetical protein